MPCAACPCQHTPHNESNVIRNQSDCHDCGLWGNCGLGERVAPLAVPQPTSRSFGLSAALLAVFTAASLFRAPEALVVRALSAPTGSGVSSRISPEGPSLVPPAQLGPPSATGQPHGRPGDFATRRQNTEDRRGTTTNFEKLLPLPAKANCEMREMPSDARWSRCFSTTRLFSSHFFSVPRYVHRVTTCNKKH
jgi:hypothetical protein